ncbi:DUF2066 domain-containing protein [Vibrio aestuarianus]|uniref:DUF2066 domain-containing protein n=1 Tax=Vibrio aestuarianus TaxID=28171 RepID=UPI00237D1FA0|nr:DUF2066 domain-containing protein [Vibrio aestuarianus]MDE1314941.1 DUF2066 domain-containing protein [Vibrio aestuarianus]
MRYLAMLVMSLMTLPAYALTKVDLYHSEITIDQEQTNADDKARVKGMEQVIIRASGDKSSVNNEVIQKALRQHSQYLAQISYAQNDSQSTIKMGFSAPHIRSLLTQAQLPFWPENRANVLVWLIEESGYDRTIAWEHSDTPRMQQLKIAADNRGLPITIPVGDFDDITGVEVSDLWGGFVQPISAASERYPTDSIVVVRVQGNNVRWNLYDQQAGQMVQIPQAPVSGQASGSNAVAEMVDQLSNYYADKSSVMVSSESSSSVLGSFSNINDAVDFFTLENKLKSLSSVASLDILRIQGESIVFKVHLLATEQDFEQEVLRMGTVNKIEMSNQFDVVSHIEQPDVVDAIAPVTSDSSLAESEVSQPDTSVANDNQVLDSQMLQETEGASTLQPTPPVENTLYFSWRE